MDNNSSKNNLSGIEQRLSIPQAEIEANKGIYQHCDANYVRQINDALFSIVETSYFRPVYVGFDEMPERNQAAHPVILASNHSGMAFPWDAMVFGCGMQKRFNHAGYVLCFPNCVCAI